jgi:hypothetical protein
LPARFVAEKMAIHHGDRKDDCTIAGSFPSLVEPGGGQSGGLGECRNCEADCDGPSAATLKPKPADLCTSTKHPAIETHGPFPVNTPINFFTAVGSDLPRR